MLDAQRHPHQSPVLPTTGQVLVQGLTTLVGNETTWHPRARHLALSLAGPLHKRQDTFVQRVLTAGRGPTTHWALGGWGAGKSVAAEAAFILSCLMNGRHKGYKGDHPRALVMAPTKAILRDTITHKFEAMIPPELVRRVWKAPEWRVLLTNGLEITSRSADSQLEGIDVCVEFLEECDHPAYWDDPKLWPNITARCRDPNSPFLRTIACGLPTSGRVREVADRPDDPTVYLQRYATTDNPGLTPAIVNAIRAACPHGLEDVYLNGDWMPPPGGVFISFAEGTHVHKGLFNPAAPVHLAIDVGNHSAVVWFQCEEYWGTGIMGESVRRMKVNIIDDMVTLKMGVSDLGMEIKLRPWDLTQDSVICLDPTVKSEERGAIRRHWPDCRIFQRTSKDPLYFVEEGLRVMQAGLRDSIGNVSVAFDDNCRRTRNGVLTAIREARRHPRSGVVVKDDRTDHARDAARYAITYALHTVAKERGLRPQDDGLAQGKLVHDQVHEAEVIHLPNAHELAAITRHLNDMYLKAA